MPWFEPTPPEVDEIVAEMLKKYHGELHSVGVTVETLFSHATLNKNGDPNGPGLSLHGYAAYAVVRINGLKDRTKGRADAEILLDGDIWWTLHDDVKRALIDHELEHIQLKVSKKRGLLRDDLDRPKLWIRKHDHQFGWFDAIVRRHGAASIELQQYEQFQEARSQKWLPFMESVA